MENQKSDLKLNRRFTLQQIKRILRGVHLKGDSSLFPYKRAVARVKKYKVSDLRPTSFYILENQLSKVGMIAKKFLSTYKIDIFQLSELLEYETKEGTFRISPPIVEKYFEPEERKNVAAIVDGEHRIYLAKSKDIKQISVVEITEVPIVYPLVPLPLSWEDVRVFSDVPKVKRKYRFPSLKDFPDISSFSKIKVKKDNFLYFFYRDLSDLGSSGVRKVGSK